MLGGVRDMTDAEQAAVTRACDRAQLLCLGANLGPTAEFTSKVPRARRVRVVVTTYRCKHDYRCCASASVSAKGLSIRRYTRTCEQLRYCMHPVHYGVVHYLRWSGATSQSAFARHS